MNPLLPNTLVIIIKYNIWLQEIIWLKFIVNHNLNNDGTDCWYYSLMQVKIKHPRMRAWSHVGIVWRDNLLVINLIFSRAHCTEDINTYALGALGLIKKSDIIVQLYIYGVPQKMVILVWGVLEALKNELQIKVGWNIMNILRPKVPEPKKKEGFGLRADTKITWATTTNPSYNLTSSKKLTKCKLPILSL